MSIYIYTYIYSIVLSINVLLVMSVTISIIYFGKNSLFKWWMLQFDSEHASWRNGNFYIYIYILHTHFPTAHTTEPIMTKPGMMMVPHLGIVGTKVKVKVIAYVYILSYSPHHQSNNDGTRRDGLQPRDGALHFSRSRLGLSWFNLKFSDFLEKVLCVRLFSIIVS